MNNIAHRLRESAKATFYDPLKSELNEAASHIEHLEAALNCNLPDYDPKIGVVERLRQLGNWRVDGTKSSPIYNKSADRIEKLEDALTHIWAWYPINVSKPHETIDAIKDYAFAAIKGEIKND